MFLADPCRIGDSLGISADSRPTYVRAVPLSYHAVWLKRSYFKFESHIFFKISGNCFSRSYCNCLGRLGIGFAMDALEVRGLCILRWCLIHCDSNFCWLMLIATLSDQVFGASNDCVFSSKFSGVHRSDHILITAFGVLLASSALLFLPEEALHGIVRKLLVSTQYCVLHNSSDMFEQDCSGISSLALVWTRSDAVSNVRLSPSVCWGDAACTPSCSSSDSCSIWCKLGFLNDVHLAGGGVLQCSVYNGEICCHQHDPYIGTDPNRSLPISEVGVAPLVSIPCAWCNVMNVKLGNDMQRQVAPGCLDLLVGKLNFKFLCQVVSLWVQGHHAFIHRETISRGTCFLANWSGCLMERLLHMVERNSCTGVIGVINSNEVGWAGGYASEQTLDPLRSEWCSTFIAATLLLQCCWPHMLSLCLT